MILRRALIIAAALAEFMSAGHAHSAGSENEFLANLLGRLYRQWESFACFSRQYDDAQLAARRGQRVTFVKALVDAYFRESSFAPAKGSYLYQVSLAFRFRDRTETLTGSRNAATGRPGIRSSVARIALARRARALISRFRDDAFFW